jgi:hypothetical protein
MYGSHAISRALILYDRSLGTVLTLLKRGNISSRLMYKFNILAIARVVVRVALRKYEIVSTGNRVYKKLILCLN